MLTTLSVADRYDAVWRAAEPYMRARKNDIHIPLSFTWAQRLLDQHPGADRDVVSLAILLHDIGWYSIDMVDIIEKGFSGPDMLKSDVRYLHEAEGVRLSTPLLRGAGWPEPVIAQVCEIIDGHDTRSDPHHLNDRLVRGFDYYTHTAFEFTTTLLGAQSAVIGGGRYDHLIEYMGGPSTAGIGWGCGIERLVMLLDEPPAPERPVAVIPVGADGEAEALVLTQQLRRAGVKTDLAFRGNVGKRMKQANKVNARIAVLVGGDELARGVVAVRDLDSGEQTEVAREKVVAQLGGN